MRQTSVPVGSTFGRLRVIGGTRSKVLCLCDCGVLRYAKMFDMVSGKTSSCGCYRREATAKNRRKHGCIGSTSTELQKKLYVCFQNMMSRCYDPMNKCWHLYGDRGISVCDRWRSNFKNFAEDMGIPPSKHHTIERNDFNGNYEPSNCRWATQSEQGLNRRNNRLVEIDGKTQSVKAWSIEYGVPYQKLYKKFRKQNLFTS